MTTLAYSTSTAARRSAAADARAIAWWLLLCAGMVLAMAVIGAVTRLTESGLSITEWRPLVGALPPLSDAEWQRVFDLYRQTPEFLYKHSWMGLEQFKSIYFWEWFHRLWGRLIGVVFAAGFLWFALRGRIARPLMPRLVGLLVLGGLQGVLGWYMVKSGLVDRPFVSHYRLAAHLGAAFLIYALLLWQAFALLITDRGAPAPARLRWLGWGTVALVAITALWGAVVAGLRAGLAYNTWPLMDGAFLPPEVWGLSPAWLNFFENTAMVQFSHRWLAVLTALVMLLLWVQARGAGLAPRAVRAADAAAAMAVIQVGLGIATLLFVVPVALGATHQGGAFVLLGLLLWLAFEMRGVPVRRPSPDKSPDIAGRGPAESGPIRKRL